MLAGVSEDYYLRLEQGRDQRPSEEVLRSLGRALRLDEYALEYLFRLAYDVELFQEHPAPSLSHQAKLDLLAHFTDTGAYVTDGNRDIVASNTLARRIGEGFLDAGGNDLIAFFDDHTRAIAPGWEAGAAVMIAALRFNSDPNSPRLHEIVEELSARSPLFARLWPRQDARPLANGVARALIDGFGEVDLYYQHLAISDWPGHLLTTIFGQPGTRGPAILAYLAAKDG